MSNLRLKKRSLSQEDLFNFSELFKLMKPRVMSLVIFTCAVGLLTSPNLVSTKDAIIGILLVSLGAGAAGALNMWYESDLDALMTRTCLRPIPAGKVNRNQALIFGITLSIISMEPACAPQEILQEEMSGIIICSLCNPSPRSQLISIIKKY